MKGTWLHLAQTDCSYILYLRERFSTHSGFKQWSLRYVLPKGIQCEGAEPPKDEISAKDCKVQRRTEDESLTSHCSRCPGDCPTFEVSVI